MKNLILLIVLGFISLGDTVGMVIKDCNGNTNCSLVVKSKVKSSTVGCMLYEKNTTVQQDRNSNLINKISKKDMKIDTNKSKIELTKHLPLILR